MTRSLLLVGALALASRDAAAATVGTTWSASRRPTLYTWDGTQTSLPSLDLHLEGGTELRLHVVGLLAPLEPDDDFIDALLACPVGVGMVFDGKRGREAAPVTEHLALRARPGFDVELVGPHLQGQAVLRVGTVLASPTGAGMGVDLALGAGWVVPDLKDYGLQTGVRLEVSGWMPTRRNGT